MAGRNEGKATIAIVAVLMVCGVGVASSAVIRQPLAALEVVDNPNVCLADAGSRGWCGDGGLAGQARLAGPRDLALLPDGGFLVADTLNHVVRRVDRRNIITTVAGNAAMGNDGDGGPAMAARLNAPTGVAVTRDGFVVADAAAHVVRKVSADGVINRFAGTGIPGGTGNGHPARNATLRSPRSVAVMDDGSVLIADSDGHRVRRVTPKGTIVAFAGTGVPGSGGDGGSARAARLMEPTYVATEPGGSVLVVDRRAGRVRRITSDGTITTVAGGRIPGIPATELALAFPSSAVSTRDGGFLVAEQASIREVRPDGSTRVVAGTGALGFTRGKSGAARATRLAYPASVAWEGRGSALVVDTSNDRIRRFSPAGAILTIAGFDQPDHHVRRTFGAGASQLSAQRAAARSRPATCRDTSTAGAYGVLRLRPSDPSVYQTKRRRAVTVYVESSAKARVTITAPRSGIKKRHVKAHPGQKKTVRLRPTRAGNFKIHAVGRLIDSDGRQSKRCARVRGLRVGS